MLRDEPIVRASEWSHEKASVFAILCARSDDELSKWLEVAPRLHMAELKLATQLLANNMVHI